MREIYCSICNLPIGSVDLRASVGVDPILLSAQELSSGFGLGLDYLAKEHEATIALLKAQQKPFHPLVKVGEFNPLDQQSRIETVSKVRRGE